MLLTKRVVHTALLSIGLTSFITACGGGGGNTPDNNSTTPTPNPTITSTATIPVTPTAVPTTPVGTTPTATPRVTSTPSPTSGPLSPVDLPLTFDRSSIDYTVSDFGNVQTSIVADPEGSNGNVAMTIKGTEATAFSGTTMSPGQGFSNPIPLTLQDSFMSVWVFSPEEDIPVMLKVESSIDGLVSVETIATTSIANAWEQLFFDFSNHRTTTSAFSSDAVYNKASIFFNFGTSGTNAGQMVFYWDDVSFEPGYIAPTVTVTPTTNPTATPSTSPTATPGPTGVISLGRPVETSEVQGTNVGANAVDDDPSSRWESTFSDDHFIQIDLGQDMFITRVVLDWEGAYGTGYSIDVSDDAVNWSSIYTTNNGDGDIDDLNLSGQGRYIRMFGTDRGTPYGFSLWEFTVYGTPADPDLPQIIIESPTAGQEISENDDVILAVSLTDSDWIANGGAYNYSLNGGDPIVVNSTSPINLGQLSTGLLTLRASLVDDSGAEFGISKYVSFRVFADCGGDCANVLVFSKTSGYRHGSIGAGIAMIQSLATDYGYNVTTTENSNDFTTENLQRYSTVVFMNTTGDVFNSAQEAAFRSYIENGGGFVGAHSAADTEHDWVWFTDTLLGGAEFLHHGDGIPTSRLEIEQPSDPIMNHLGTEWTMRDEWYFWVSSPRGVGNIEVLANLDRSSYNSNYPVEDHPIIFKNTVGSGRAFYTAIGHVDDNFSDPNMMEMMRKAIDWTSGN